VTCPGAYRTVCVHLRLHHLAVAALVKAQELAEMEGASGLDGLGAGAPAFGVLRRLVEVRGRFPGRRRGWEAGRCFSGQAGGRGWAASRRFSGQRPRGQAWAEAEAAPAVATAGPTIRPPISPAAPTPPARSPGSPTPPATAAPSRTGCCTTSTAGCPTRRGACTTRGCSARCWG
jgi:hypothetical protein